MSGQESFGDEVRADFARWEGRIPWMYLDTVGRVTVGVGFMLPDQAAAQKLAFVLRDGGASANPAQIAADFDTVKAQPEGLLAQYYKAYTKLDLPDAVINSMLDQLIAGVQKNLQANFTGYDGYPPACQRALIDMAYNLGIGGLLKFPKLKAAAECGDWTVAANECFRRGPSQERNDWTKNLFLSAVKAD